MKTGNRPKKAPGFTPAEKKRVAKQWRSMAIVSWALVVFFTAIATRDVVRPHGEARILSIEEVLLPFVSLILAIGSTLMWWVYRGKSGRPS